MLVEINYEDSTQDEVTTNRRAGLSYLVMSVV